MGLKQNIHPCNQALKLVEYYENSAVLRNRDNVAYHIIYKADCRYWKSMHERPLNFVLQRKYAILHRNKAIGSITMTYCMQTYTDS